MGAKQITDREKAQRRKRAFLCFFPGENQQGGKQEPS